MIEMNLIPAYVSPDTGRAHLLIAVPLFILVCAWVICKAIELFKRRRKEDELKVSKALAEGVTACPESHLAWAVLSTVFCFLPLGIVAIIKAAGVNSAWVSGQKEAALRNSLEAKLWCQLATLIPVAGFAAYILAAVSLMIGRLIAGAL